MKLKERKAGCAASPTYVTTLEVDASLSSVICVILLFAKIPICYKIYL